MKSILIKGGIGFIGSNFVPSSIDKYPENKIIKLDKFTYVGDVTKLTKD